MKQHLEKAFNENNQETLKQAKEAIINNINYYKKQLAERVFFPQEKDVQKKLIEHETDLIEFEKLEKQTGIKVSVILGS